jgi:predicted metal-dependent hydrolase
MLLRQLFSIRKSTVAPPLEPFVIDLDGRPIRIAMKRHATARRMVLRLTRDGDGFALTMPKRQSVASARAFVETSRLWMLNTLERRGRRQEATQFLFRGEPTQIVKLEKARGLVVHDAAENTLAVPGGEAHWKRRLTDWLKKQADVDLRKASAHYAEKMDVTFTRLTVRDQRSRWGSCSHDGALSYSWRLVMAPPFVLDYVAAHEVAHLKEMNHGPRFWRMVLTHCTQTREAKRWLKANGHTLHHTL